MCERENSNSTVTTKRPSAEATLKFMAKSHLSGEASCALKKNKVDRTEVQNALSPSQRLQFGIPKNSKRAGDDGKREKALSPFPHSIVPRALFSLSPATLRHKGLSSYER